MKKILNRVFYIFVKVVVGFLAIIFFRLKVEGRDNILPKGPFIIACNHTSFLDVGVVQVAFPLKISWIAKKEVVDRWWLRPAHWIFDTITINGAVEKALEALEEGRVLGIFPEGARSPDGKIKKTDAGVAILALKSGMPIIPVGIMGAFEAYPPGKKFFKPHPITVKIGKPFSFKREQRDMIQEDILTEKRVYIIERIKDLLA